VTDLAHAHVKALVHILSKPNSSYYDFFNIGTGEGSSVLQVIQAFEKATNQHVNYEVRDRRPGDITAVYAATEKSNNILGWKAKISLEEALNDAWAWQKALL
jgi:UDP-glucose 4-epimerase